MTQASSTGIGFGLAFLASTCLIELAPAIERDLVHAVPEKTLAAILIEAGSGERSGSALGLLATGLKQAGRIGLLSGMEPDTRLVLDLIAAWPTLTEQPMVVALTYVAVRPYRRGHRLDTMRLALLLKTSGRNERVMGTIQQLLNRYTNSAVARVIPVDSGPPGRFRLIDTRLPTWAVIDWGPIGDFYVVGFGEGAFDDAAGALRADSPAAVAQPLLRQAYDDLNGQRAAALWLVDFAALRSSLEPAAPGIPEAVLQSLDLADVDQGAWSLYRFDRAFGLKGLYLRGMQTERFTIAAAANQRERSEGLIPAEADAYALIRWDPKRHVLRARDAYLHMRSPSNAGKLRRSWAGIEEELGFSFERDLLHQLGPRLLIHTYPRHPLGLGALCTIQIEIAGSSSIVRSTIDKLLTHWHEELVIRGPVSASGRAYDYPILREADDGVWYVQLGLAGPGVAVCEGWIVVSFSPQAVRMNHERLDTARRADSPAGKP